MLPITNQRAIHIPHSIATGAAIVGLIVALGWNPTDKEAISADAGDSVTEQVASVATQASELPAEAPSPARSSGKESESGVFSGLLPLVLPSISGF